MIIRPAKREDLDDIMDMVDRSGFGLTSLPKDRDLIAQRLDRSLETFSGGPEDGKEKAYLLVMEDATSGRVLGTGGLISRVGIGEPFYSYRIETHVHESRSLGVRKEVACLHLLKIQEGPCEIGSLFVHPDFQKHGHGRLMSLSRFHFLAGHSDLFPSKVIAEMRGVIDARGRCPFWEAVGRRFFDTDFPMADYLTMKDKRFIGELMPTHPIYIPLLPEEARSAIGRVHDRTRPALKLLQSEGFEDSGMVDIFDGGPIVQCDISEIRTVKQSREGILLGPGDPGSDTEPWLLSRGRLGRFRATVSHGILEEPGGIRLPRSVVESLGLESGEMIRYVPLRDNRG